MRESVFFLTLKKKYLPQINHGRNNQNIKIKMKERERERGKEHFDSCRIIERSIIFCLLHLYRQIISLV